jgi:hypothetical protein
MYFKVFGYLYCLFYFYFNFIVFLLYFTFNFTILVKIFYLRFYDSSLRFEFILYIPCRVKKIFLTTLLAYIRKQIHTFCRLFFSVSQAAIEFSNHPCPCQVLRLGQWANQKEKKTILHVRIDPKKKVRNS